MSKISKIILSIIIFILASPSFVTGSSAKTNSREVCALSFVNSFSEVIAHEVLEDYKSETKEAIVGAYKTSYVVAPSKGKVIFVGKFDKNKGQAVGIEHDCGYRSYFFHISKAYVKRGQTVEAGKKIAKVGMTGKYAANFKSEEKPNRKVVGVGLRMKAGDKYLWVNPSDYQLKYDVGCEVEFVNPAHRVEEYTVGREFGCYEAMGYKYCTSDVDLLMPERSPVSAAADGTAYRGEDNFGAQYTIIQHSCGLQTRYWHGNGKFYFDNEEEVKAGDLIMESGRTGLTTGPVLGFGLHHNGHPIDPKGIVPYEPAE